VQRGCRRRSPRAYRARLPTCSRRWVPASPPRPSVPSRRWWAVSSPSPGCGLSPGCWWVPGWPGAGITLARTASCCRPLAGRPARPGGVRPDRGSAAGRGGADPPGRRRQLPRGLRAPGHEAVVTEDGASPSGRAGAVAATCGHCRSCRPCHPRAISSGHQRIVTVTRRRPLRCAPVPDWGWEEAETAWHARGQGFNPLSSTTTTSQVSLSLPRSQGWRLWWLRPLGGQLEDNP
jgi:hypothetical protein